jgi:hypothetical protein
MVRRRSTVRFRKGARPPSPLANRGGVAQWRCSSVRQSKRLIIAVSPVQIRPPLRDRTGRQPSPCLDRAITLGYPTTFAHQPPSKEATRSGSHRCPTEDHDGLQRVQAPQLHHPQEPAQRPRSHGTEEVLPELPHPHCASRDALTGLLGRAVLVVVASHRRGVGLATLSIPLLST